MFLAARTRQLNLSTAPKGAASAIEAAHRVTTITGRPVAVRASVHSAGVGRILWSIRVDSLKELEEFDDLLAADTGWNDWVASQDGLYTGPVDDVLVAVVHGASDGEPANYVSSVMGVCSPGKMSAGMAAGVEIATMVTKVTGHSCVFGATMTGAYGGVAWITGAPDLGAAESANMALMQSPEWMDLIDRVGPCYEPGAATSLTMYRRLA